MSRQASKYFAIEGFVLRKRTLSGRSTESFPRHSRLRALVSGIILLTTTEDKMWHSLAQKGFRWRLEKCRAICSSIEGGGLHTNRCGLLVLFGDAMQLALRGDKPGLAPAGHSLFCFAKKVSKKGAPGPQPLRGSRIQLAKEIFEMPFRAMGWTPPPPSPARFPCSRDCAPDAQAPPAPSA